MKRYAGYFANTIMVLCILALTFLLFAILFFGFRFEKILSGSMEPYISTGDIIGIIRINPENIRVGDVIGFSVEGIDLPVCHRVIEINQNEDGREFRTRGDANDDPDPWLVKQENVIGKVILVLPWLGHAARFAKSPAGFALFCALPALIIVAMEIRSILVKPGRAKIPWTKRDNDGFPAYLCLVIGFIVTALLWAILELNTQDIKVYSGYSGNAGSQDILYKTITNKSIVPVIICLDSTNKSINFSEDFFTVLPGKKKQLEIRLANSSDIIKIGTFFPLLPGKMLYNLFIWNYRFGYLVSIALWTIPPTIIGFLILSKFSNRTKFRSAVYKKGYFRIR